jgi:hypothetical protein
MQSAPMESIIFLIYYKTNVTHCFCRYVITCNKYSLLLLQCNVLNIYMHEGDLTLTETEDCFLHYNLERNLQNAFWLSTYLLTHLCSKMTPNIFHTVPSRYTTHFISKWDMLKSPCDSLRYTVWTLLKFYHQNTRNVRI